jgi:hypothetical protein
MVLLEIKYHLSQAIHKPALVIFPVAFFIITYVKKRRENKTSRMPYDERNNSECEINAKNRFFSILY